MVQTEVQVAQELETLGSAAKRLGMKDETLRSRAKRHVWRNGVAVVWPRLQGEAWQRNWVAPSEVWDALAAMPVASRDKRQVPTPAPALEFEKAVVRPVAWSSREGKREVGRGLAIHCPRCKRGNVLWERGEGEWRCMACGRPWEPRGMAR